MVNIFGKNTKTDKESTRSSKEGSVILSDDERDREGDQYQDDDYLGENQPPPSPHSSHHDDDDEDDGQGSHHSHDNEQVPLQTFTELLATNKWVKRCSKDPQGSLSLLSLSTIYKDSLLSTEDRDRCIQHCRDFCETRTKANRETAQKFAEQLDKARAQAYEAALKVQGESLTKAAIFTDPDMMPPTDFPTNPSMSLVNDHDYIKIEKAVKHFKLFSGDSSYPIHEYFDQLSDAQSAFKLSEPDFKKVLKKTTTGRPHEQISQMIESKRTLEEIYRTLASQYDNRISANDAYQKLLNYKANKDTDLSMIFSDILTLANRAARETPLENRQTCIDSTSIEALMRALPAESEIRVKEIKSDLSAIHKRLPTFDEVTACINKQRDRIQADIAKNGTDQHNDVSINKSNKKGNKSSTNHFQGKNKFNHFNRKKVNAIKSAKATTNAPTDDAQPQVQYVHLVQSPVALGQIATPAVESTPNTGKKKSSKGQKQPKAEVNAIQGKPPNGQHNRNKPGNKPNTGAKPLSRCTHCNGRNHTAADVCFAMFTDSGAQTKQPPSNKPCKICKDEFKIELYHPETYCPWRNRAKQLYEQGKVKPIMHYKKRFLSNANNQ